MMYELNANDSSLGSDTSVDIGSVDCSISTVWFIMVLTLFEVLKVVLPIRHTKSGIRHV